MREQGPTPPRLWNDAIAQKPSVTCVPAVRPLEVTWELADLSRACEVLQLRRCRRHGRRCCVASRATQAFVWEVLQPVGVQVLVARVASTPLLRTQFRPAYHGWVSLGHRSSKPSFSAATSNQAIDGIAWPPSLEHLAFSWGFDQPVAGVL